MPIDTGARSHGRALSRIGPAPRAAGRTPQARALQRSARISTTRQIATAPGLSTAQRIASAPPHLRANLTAELGRVEKALHSTPSAKGLDIPAPIAKLDVKIGRQEHYPASLLASQQLHESNFNPGAVSSAGAKGISQFIDSTASQYGVHAGTDKPAVKSQIRGQARYMKDLGAPANSAQALGRYLGDGNPNSSYAQGILADQAKYKALDKPGKKPNPKDINKLAKAGIAATKSGVPAKQAPQATSPGLSPQRQQELRAMNQAMNHVAGTPYVLGGGHGGFSDHPSSLDCSGAVSYVLHKAGILNTPLTSGAMGQVLKPGRGLVNVYYNAGHTFMGILTKHGEKFWGTSAGDNGAGGLGQHPNPGQGYLSQYQVGHVPGFGPDAAAALGFKLRSGGSTSGGASGGGTGGGGGTTATFTSGTIKASAGWSNHPIKAVAASKKLNQTDSFLSGIGSSAGPAPSKSTSTLSSLRRSYGNPTV